MKDSKKLRLLGCPIGVALFVAVYLFFNSADWHVSESMHKLLKYLLSWLIFCLACGTAFIFWMASKVDNFEEHPN